MILSLKGRKKVTILKTGPNSNVQNAMLCTNLIRKSKRNFFQESIESNKGNPNNIWKALKSLTKSKKQSQITELSMEPVYLIYI